jgi:prepilin-type N-terminal cleavage/methylation domain-containing protein/prepilin-type processing-associated H-X9-DG protein
MRQRVRGAFTLIELAVVIAILVLLLLLAAGAVGAARRQGRRLVCLSNLRQIALGAHAYAADHGERFPIAQIFDQRLNAWVAWDTVTMTANPCHAKPGLIWEHVGGGAVQQCPSYEGPSMTTGDPYTGYNYNTTYLGRGQNEGCYRGMGEAPALVSEVRFPGRVAFFGDGGWSGGANKFMRAPLDAGVPEGAVHAGAQAFRHLDATNLVYVDGHGEFTTQRFRKPGAEPAIEALLGWPENGFLSEDDRAYAHR